MRKLVNRLGRLSALVAGIVTAVCAHAADDLNQTSRLIKRGAYLATASDCVACHTAPEGKPFAGGLAISTPLGTIYSTNITSSKDAGIGNYTEQEFSDAVRHGIRRDGGNLYPAMPYTSYAKLTDDDVHALYTYFTQAVTPVDKPGPKTSLPFPMNVRMSMRLWNLLFLDPKPYEADPRESVEWNRGAYLVQGAAHCGTCHTPRGFLMQELASQGLAGADVGPWHAPNITSDPTSGIGNWTHAELVEYLRTGRVAGKAQAGGSMGEAVEHSFQYLTTDDLNAIATYVKAVPPVHDPADDASRFTQGKASMEVVTLRGTDGVTNGDSNPTGAELFQGNCASCHSAHGEGSKDGYYPSLFDNSVTGSRAPKNVIAAILYGVDRTTAHGQAFMPGFGGKPTDAEQLSNREVALLGSYVLQQYGGHSNAPITEQDVAQARRGGPSSNLIALARGGIVAGLIVVLLALCLLLGRRKKVSFS
ncbi:cytochrome c [Paraburkholderia sp. EG287B]|uniref:c-type cytochrome n=1 Tax=unclassified Paraburkholderia TaxID=2615204 RepID=UPI0034D2617F